VVLILRLNESDAQSHRREARTTKGGWRKRAIIDVCALDQEKGIPSFLSQASDLSPQTSSNQAAVQIKDALPFHERLGSKVVIADAESLDAD